MQVDIEAQMIVKKRQANGASGGVKFEGFKQVGAGTQNNEVAGNGEEREITEFEKECLKRFEQNDEEIDEMLDVVIDQLDRIKMQAENINLEIDTQGKLLRRVGDKAEKARQGLEKKNSRLGDLLSNYRSQNKCYKDIGLVVCLLILLFLNYQAMKKKGWLP